MKVTVKSSDQTFVVEVDSDDLVENLKAILEVEIWFKGHELPGSLKLSAVGVCEDSILTLATSINSSAKVFGVGGHLSIQGDDSIANPTKLQKHLQGDHVAMAEPQREQGRPSKRQHQDLQDPTAYSQSNEYLSTSQPINNLHPIFTNDDLLFSDPFNVDAQRRIEETIQQRNVDDNWEAAIEHNPEAFAQVIMLYVDMEVNSFPLKAFVDSGAQSTIISMDCAERCGLLRLLDRRYVGVAKGVGQSVIVGRIHVAPLKIGSNYYPCSFMVLEHADIEFIFGLDMLRKHQCTIDLKENVLWIGGGEHAVPFLQEKDLPLHLNADGRPDASPSSMRNVSSNPRLATHPAAPTHARLVQGCQPTNSGPSCPSRSPQGESENAKVQRLIDLGFNTKQAVDALSLFHGNEDQAASFLFGG